MANIFITVNKFTNIEQSNNDYKFWNNIRDFLNSEVSTIDQYREWVYQWRAYEKELVSAIRYFRKMKNDAKIAGDSSSCNYLQCEKLYLRSKARELYEKRMEKKDFFKKSNFFQNSDINNIEVKELETN